VGDIFCWFDSITWKSNQPCAVPFFDTNIFPPIFCVIQPNQIFLCNSHHFLYLFLSQSNQTNHIKPSNKTQISVLGDHHHRWAINPRDGKKRGFSKALIWQGGAEAPPKEA